MAGSGDNLTIGLFANIIVVQNQQQLAH